MGNIGAGKTTLCKNLAKTIPNSRVAYEEFEENKYLPLFYKHLTKNGPGYNPYAYPMQMEFFKSRYERELKCLNNKESWIIDRCILEDRHVFGQNFINTGILNKSETEKYIEYFESHYKKVAKPSIYIYLRATVDVLQSRYKYFF